MSKEKAAFIIRSNELSAEKFTDQDYDNRVIAKNV